MPSRAKSTDKETSASSRASIPTRTVTLKIPENPVLVMVSALMIVSFLVGVLVTNIAYKVNSGQLAMGTNSQTAGGNSANAAVVAPAASTAPVGPVKVDPGNYPALGDPNAPVTVIEFADFRCPFCEQLFTSVEPSLKKDYIDTGKVKFYFRNYAFLGPASVVAANAAECANDQGKFWAMHDWFYQNQPAETDTSQYTVNNLTQVAGTLGMDTTQFSDCLTNNKFQTNVDKDMSDGNAAGVTGTPATFINGVLISGAVPYTQFQAEINKDLKAAGK